MDASFDRRFKTQSQGRDELYMVFVRGDCPLPKDALYHLQGISNLGKLSIAVLNLHESSRGISSLQNCSCLQHVSFDTLSPRSETLRTLENKILHVNSE